MRVLLLHQNFPGQFGHVAKAWASRAGWDVRALGRISAPGLPGFAGLGRYALARNGRSNQHPYLRQLEAATLHGQATARAMLQLRKRGFTPEVILAHPGWGETLYAKDVFPDTRLVHYCEWYYNASGADLGFDPEFPATFDDRARVRTWNALHTLNLTNCDAAVTPTVWQKRRHPEIFQPKITVQHEGIATDDLDFGADTALVMPNGTVLRPGDPVVTFVARNLEPYRGFHIFMRALERLQQAHSTCHAVIIGGDEVSYGRRPKDAASFGASTCCAKSISMRPELTSSVVCPAISTYVRCKSPQRTCTSHIRSCWWSLLEAMACGAPVIASDTSPVQEVVIDGVNGKLFDFFSIQALERLLLEALNVGFPASLRRQAQKDAGRFCLSRGLDGYTRLLKS